MFYKLNYFLDKTDLLNKGLYDAAGNRDLETVKYMLEKGATKLNSALINAAFHEDLNI